jgi:colanic acid/amylovoran biosynthesis glycosyltransferase
MKIGIIADTFPTLSQTFIARQAHGLTDLGHQVEIVCDQLDFDSKNPLYDDPLYTDIPSTTLIPNLILKISGKMARYLPWRISNFIRTTTDLVFASRLNRFDILIANFAWNGAYLAKARNRKILRKPFITLFHGIDIGPPLHGGDRTDLDLVLKSGQYLAPVSNFFASLLIKAGANRDKIQVIPACVDTSAISFKPRESGNLLRIIQVGRLVEKKGIAYSIQALKLLSQRRPDIKWEFRIVGDGPLKKELLLLSQELETRIVFEGSVSPRQVMNLVEQSDIFMLPSVTGADGDIEGIPVVIKEAMASGACVISTTHAGIPEMIKHNVNGLLAPERDAECLSRHIEFLSDHPEIRADMALAARETVETAYDTKLEAILMASLCRQAVSQ